MTLSFPTLQPESFDYALQFALLLRDGFANSDQLMGEVTVTSGAVGGQQKDTSGTFLFFDLKPGAQVLAVSCAPDTPYYLSANIPVTIPMPSALWPGFPDQTLADPNLPLGDPGQTPAYKSQRQLATLLPAAAYPFPGGSTLVRGTVLHGGLPLAAATVQQSGGTDPAYTTGADGQFVLFLSSPPGVPQPITLVAKHAGLADGNANVTVIRGLSVSVAINM